MFVKKYNITLIYKSDRPSLDLSPDHLFGTPGVICFFYEKGHIIFADNYMNKTYMYIDKKPLLEMSGVKPNKVHHTVLIAYYNKYFGTDKTKKDIDRGRIAGNKKSFNLWYDIKPNRIIKILKALKKYNLLVNAKSYTIGTVDKSGAKLYKVYNRKYI